MGFFFVSLDVIDAQHIRIEYWSGQLYRNTFLLIKLRY
jgi:hypothetical protein